MDVTIRLALPSDAEQLSELAARTFRETFAADNRPEDIALHLATSYEPSRQRAEISDPDVTTLLAQIDGELAAFAQLRTGRMPECVKGKAPIELWRFYLSRQWHGRGIAQALMTRVEVEACRRGGRTLWLGVWELNERAHAFYRKAGFVEAGSHAFMVGTDAQVDRVMIRLLAPASELGAS